MFYLVLFTSLWIASKAVCTNECDLTTNMCSPGSNSVCMADPITGCNTCQACNSCDPADTTTCSNFGYSYQCLQSTYPCYSCQYCACTAASGGCRSPQTCDLGAGGSNTQCGVCVDPTPTTTTAVDPCPNACDSAYNTCPSNLVCLPDATSGCKSCQSCECTAGGGCVSGEICGSVGNNGCGVCGPDPTFVTTTTSQCACTALGGCTAPQTCDFTGSGGTANDCGVCIDPPPETTTAVDPCPNACDRDPTLNACSSLGSNLVCLPDSTSTSGCTTCQDPDPCSSYAYNCDPADAATCSNYGNSYQCLPTAWGDYTCNSCQYCECTAASGTTGGCTTGVCTFASPVGNNGCGVCVEACSGIATCESAAECTAATTPGTVGSCVDVNNDGCKVCVFPEPAFTTTTTVVTEFEFEICPNGCDDDAGCVLSEYECGEIDANTGCGTCLLRNRCSDTGECIFTAAYNGCSGGTICVQSTPGSSTICDVCQCEECAEDVDCQFANSAVQGRCVKNASTDRCGTCGVSQDIATTSGVIIVETGTTAAAVSGECGAGCKVGDGECESYEICKEDGDTGCGICQEAALQAGANQYGSMMVIGFVMMIFSWM